MAPVGRPPKYTNVEEFQELIDEYFRDQDLQGRPYTITGLSLKLGMTRQKLIDYTEKDEFRDAIKRAKERCHEYTEEFLYSGKAAAGAIFSLKNNYGWKDKTEVESTLNVRFSLADLHKGNEQLREAPSTVEVIAEDKAELHPAKTQREEDSITDNWKANTVLIED